MKATKQYFPVVLFSMLSKVALTFESVDEILKCDHSNESYWAVLSRSAVYYAVLRWLLLLSLWMKSLSVTIQMKATQQFFSVVLFCCAVQGGSNFWVFVTIQMKATEQYVPVMLFIMLYTVVITN